MRPYIFGNNSFGIGAGRICPKCTHLEAQLIQDQPPVLVTIRVSRRRPLAAP